MLTGGSLANYFNNIPDKDLTKLALNNRKGLEEFCILLTLDAQMYEEENSLPQLFS
jgi:hypothetical protein